MKTVLITGSSSGIGYETALSFARKGFKVIATMRDIEKNKNLQLQAEQEKLNIDIRKLDVTDQDSAQQTVKDLLETYQKIDILINNAGSGFLGSVEQTSLAQAKEIMDVNFFGVWTLTQAVLPSMRKNRSGHIISVTSAGGIIGQPFNDAYCAAKFAVEGMMESLAPVLKRFGIQVSLIEPGPVNSEFVSSTLNKSPNLQKELDNDYKLMLNSYTTATQEIFKQYAQSSQEVSNIILDVAMTSQPHFRYQTSDISKKIANLKFTDATGNQVISISGVRLPEVIN